MAGSWSVITTKVLIALWGQESTQNQLERIHRNQDAYQRVSMELEDYGYDKSWQQSQTKIKNLTQQYRKLLILQ